MKNKRIIATSLELGQMVFGNPVGEYECPEYVEALFGYIFEEIERVYWNKNQKEWVKYEDPGFKGLEIRGYYWGDNKRESGKPNFRWNGVELRWYKYFGRSMTVNVSMTEKQWVEWFNDCLGYIRKNENEYL